MTRNLKALALALVAVFAMSAMAASSASATDVITSPESQTVSGTGTDHVFTITSPDLAVKCTTANFSATVVNGATQTTVHATYEGTPEVTPHTKDCGSDLGTVDVDMNGCDYNLSGNTVGGDAAVWITCPVGKEIQLTATEIGVTLSVPAQTPTSGGVKYTNESGGKIKVTATVNGITYTYAPTFLCGLGGISKEGNNADYTGNVVVGGSKAIEYSEE